MVVTATVTLVDMISNIGGTLGLCCGLSVLSVVEAVYWAWKCLVKGTGAKYGRKKGVKRRVKKINFEHASKEKGGKNA